LHQSLSTLLSLKTLLVSLVIVIFLHSGICIKCWICHSDADPKCADPFDNTSLPIKDCREVHLSHLTVDEGDYEKLNRQWQVSHSQSGASQTQARPPRLMEATMCRKVR